MALGVAVPILHIGGSEVWVACCWPALLAPNGDGPRKDGSNNACLNSTWLASRGKRASLSSGKKDNRKKKSAMLKVACRNVRTMQDSEDNNRPQRRIFLVFRELARLDIETSQSSVK